MRMRRAVCAALLLSLFALLAEGCGDPPPPRAEHAAKRGDDYLKKYVEKEVRKKYANDGNVVEVRRVRRDGKNWRADIVATENGVETAKSVVLRPDGGIVEEAR